ncbi:putative protein OS=Tsukamurella paurometabola (strain ATCC 8368 / DSM / CCUG 35730 /CIP 100753 / JCM 10117 / KCTC 9821 / NBRC 16120 / NCIMB 702349/ NCTC 13040) OX=521096 GN=Tpau_2626 PE=4 SV=1 [Tsukamurella paurometabola]|uniref:Uncharacterized protein n=1 Tax=Tsukamurella paurometabola (strain ATCC 8368 / DSM 20162 / CCUG 35730 / CIP 100753 / JCM 10117 / KCTC 9821 / NBRC 16120 / NCIMB 702349 / NCTC 13040) TaxID=521096 RepID=D5USF6_TSUPD|nr:hypothetical protein [Tsukamurella paurometabola]ADG79227.1 conserved hypothetical protein [Tsukamurella paurometabola DSM 20162]SUP34650.1 Uncharacterised protein [Tsukamurella paurometabola]
MTRTWAPVAAVAAVAVVLAYWLGSVTAPPVTRISDDRLGPEASQSIEVYLRKAAETLAAAPSGEGRWALISPATAWSTEEVWRRYGAAAGMERIGRVLVRVPIPGVQTPTVPVPTGQSAAGIAAVNELAAYAVPSLVAPGERGAAIARVSAARLRAGVPAVVGIVVYGTGDALRTAASGSGVRAVQVVPDGGGVFAVAPLLPSFTDRAEPGADDGSVPPA